MIAIWFMTDRQIFARLDGKPVAKAMADLEKMVEHDGGYGFVGCKGDHGNQIFQWRPGDPWKDKVRGLLEWARP